jgi:hypothetical protein
MDDAFESRVWYRGGFLQVTLRYYKVSDSHEYDPELEVYK